MEFFETNGKHKNERKPLKAMKNQDNFKKRLELWATAESMGNHGKSPEN